MDDFGTMTSINEKDIVKKLQYYNDFYDDKPSLQIQAVPVGDKLLLEGQLRICWGIIHPILFKEKDDEQPMSPQTQHRHSYSPAVPDATDFVLNFDLADGPLKNGSSEKGNAEEGKNRFGAVVMRNGKKRKKTRKRLSIINGHLYSTETSLFKPVHGTMTGVTVTSLLTTQQVIKALLDKFKVENHPIEFCLCIAKSNGERYALKDMDFPLLERIRQGPHEDEVKIFIMEKYRLLDISEEVAQFVNLPEAVLVGFLEKYTKDEEMEKGLIREKYKTYREKLEERLDSMSSL